jgi:hypothetical protein
MNVQEKYQPAPARGKLHGMRVVFKGGSANPVEWTVLDRHPMNGHWWLHRRDALGTWVTTFARYNQLLQIID